MSRYGRLLVVLLAGLLGIAAVIVPIALVEKHLSGVRAELRARQGRNQVVQEALWQQQAALLERGRHQPYLRMLEQQLTSRHPSGEAPDVAHSMNVLRHSALSLGWQSLMISHSVVAGTLMLELEATVRGASLPALWVQLLASGNLFDIHYLALQVSGAPGIFRLRASLLPRLVGSLPQASTCASSRCEPVMLRPKPKRRGFLLRSQNSREQLTNLASDSQGRISTILDESLVESPQ